MGDQKVQLTLDNFEQRLMVSCLNTVRNQLISVDGPTEDVEDLIIKVIDAPPKKKGLFKSEDR